MPPPSGRCLLIAPLSFYAFHDTIRGGLEVQGYDVELLNEEFPANAFGKVLGKLAMPLLRLLTERKLRELLDKRERYALVLIIKGRGLGPASLSYLRSRADRIVGYNFDSFRFNPSPLDWLKLTDRYATFDIVDAQDHGLALVHLFSAAPPRAPVDVRQFDLSIIMRVHSQRLAYVERVLTAVPDARCFIFLYESSRLTFLLGLLRRPGLYFRLRRHIYFKPLPYLEAMDAIARSHATLDYAHPHQSGITVRCFEARSLGVAVITNNASLSQVEGFDPAACAVFQLNDDPVTLPSAVERMSRLHLTPTKRTIDDFLVDLLGGSQLSKGSKS